MPGVNYYTWDVRVLLRKGVLLREGVNIEPDREVKKGIEKSVCKYGCPLTRVSVKRRIH